MRPIAERFLDRVVVSRGSFATAFKAHDTQLRRTVFLKVLHPELSTDSDTRARFEREARAAAQLNHPNLVRLFEFGEDPREGLFMVFEWIEGRNLAAVLKQDGPCTADCVRSLAGDLLLGLSVLHQAGIVHRDLKPENILVSEQGPARITDFSLANFSNEPQLTHHQAVIGTPAYMSPEQAAGKKPTERSDLFAVGVVLFEAVTGSNPFAADNVVQSMRRVRQFDPSFDNPAIAALPADLQGLIRACLEKSVENRPASAAASLGMISISVPSVPRVGGRRRPLLVIGAILIAVVAIGWLAFWLRSRSPAVAPVVSVVPVATDSVSSPLGDSVIALTPLDVPREVVHRGAPESANATAADSPIARQQAPVADSHKSVPDSATARGQGAESLSVVIDVEPWANILLRGNRLGTSPLKQALKLPRGTQWLSFDNSELPRVDLPVTIERDGQHIQIRLTDHVALIQVIARPWGFVNVDGESRGATPLKRPLFLTPGSHSVKVSHPGFKDLVRDIQVNGGDTLLMNVDMDQAAISVEQTNVSHH
jgi:serine/threonine protein kinase